MKRNGRVNIFRMYLHRYLRITPALAMLILVQKFIRFFNDGPFYNGFTKNFQVKCDKYWWSALLHVQNYVNPLQTVSFILNFVQLKQLNRQLKLLLVLEPLVVFVRWYAIVLVITTSSLSASSLWSKIHRSNSDSSCTFHKLPLCCVLQQRFESVHVPDGHCWDSIA